MTSSWCQSLKSQYWLLPLMECGLRMQMWQKTSCAILAAPCRQAGPEFKEEKTEAQRSNTPGQWQANGRAETVEVRVIQSPEGHRPSNGLDWSPCLSTHICKMGADSSKAAQTLVRGVT